jgi:ornithine decarboxylase
MGVLSIVEKKIVERTALGNENAFYLLKVEDIKTKYRKWIAKIPRVTPYYAVKCNNNQTVLEILKDAGAGFDCSSIREMKSVLNLGVHPDKIIYAHTVKEMSHLKFAAEKNILKITFDSERELHKIKKFHPNAQLVMRIRFDAEKTSSGFGMKFGCDRFSEAPKLIELCKTLNLNLIGVSFHVGENAEDNEIYQKAIKAVREIFDLAQTFDFDMKFVDIGGGFRGNSPDIIEKYSKTINRAIQEHFNDPTYQIIAEPGRYFVESAFTRAVKIVLKKTFNDGVIDYFVNDGIFMSFFTEFIFPKNQFLNFGEIKVVKKNRGNLQSKNSPKVLSNIWGMTCCPIDRISYDILLPELEMGDWLVFENMGAYTISVASNGFNGFHIEDDDIIII